MLWVIKTQQQGHFSNFPLPLLTKVAPAKAVHAHPGEGSSPALPPYISKGLHETWRKKKYMYIYLSQVPFPHAGQRTKMLRRNGDRRHTWILSSLFFKSSAKLGHGCLLFYFEWHLSSRGRKNQLNREFPQSSRPLSFLLNIHVTPRHSGVSYMTDTLG